MTAMTGSFNGLAFGTGTNLPITDINGFRDMPAIRNRDQARANVDGDTSAPDLTQARTIQLVLGLRGDSPADLAALKTIVETAFSTQSAALPLIINDRLVYAKTRRRTVDEDRGYEWRIGQVALEFYCADPRWYSATEQIQTTGLAATTGGFAFPFAFPFSFGSGASGGSIAAFNSGSAPTPVQITYSGGQLTNPGSVQLETGRKLKMGLVVQSTETLVINTGDHTVAINGTASRRSSLTIDQWFLLQPGTNTITFETDSSTGTPQMELRWRSAWL